MEFWNFIRNLFGGKSLEEPKNLQIREFKWQNDIDDIDNSRYFKGNNHFPIFNDPLQMTRYFESQIENMLINFFYGFNNRGDNVGILPFVSPQKENLRDEVLKPNNDQMELKLDTDLDERVTIDNFSNIWEEHDKPKLEASRPFIIRKSMRKEYVRKPDGTVQQKQVIIDCEGNEETIISHQVGDKIHTVITKIDKNGVETKAEDFSNISESDLAGKKKPLNEEISFYNIDLNFFPWDKFFKPDPKL